MHRFQYEKKSSSKSASTNTCTNSFDSRRNISSTDNEINFSSTTPTPGFIGSLPNTHQPLTWLSTPQQSTTFGSPAQNLFGSGITPLSQGFGSGTGFGVSTSQTSGINWNSSTSQSSSGTGFNPATPQNFGASLGVQNTQSQFPSTMFNSVSTSFPSLTPGQSAFSPFGNTTTSQPNPLLGIFSCTSQTTPSINIFPSTSASSSPFNSPFTLNTNASTTQNNFFGLSATPPLNTASFGLGTSGNAFGLLSPNISAPIPATSSTLLEAKTSIGLGGTDKVLVDAVLPELVKNIKNSEVSEETVQLISKFEEYVQAQKSASSEIAGQTFPKTLLKVSKDAESLKQLQLSISSSLHNNLLCLNKLKNETETCIQNNEIAHRTQKSLTNLPYDYEAPPQWSSKLALSFTDQIKSFEIEIKNIENCLRGLSQRSTLSLEEVSAMMRRFHETFVALAGRLQALQTKVEIQKQRYIDFRKRFFVKDENIFNDSPISRNMHNTLQPENASGPSPFSDNPNISRYNPPLTLSAINAFSLFKALEMVSKWKSVSRS